MREGEKRALWREESRALSIYMMGLSWFAAVSICLIVQSPASRHVRVVFAWSESGGRTS